MFGSKLKFLRRLIFSYQLEWLYLYGNDTLYDREGFNSCIFIILGVTRRRKSRFNILLHFFVMSQKIWRKSLRGLHNIFEVWPNGADENLNLNVLVSMVLEPKLLIHRNITDFHYLLCQKDRWSLESVCLHCWS